MLEHRQCGIIAAIPWTSRHIEQLLLLACQQHLLQTVLLVLVHSIAVHDQH